MVKNLPANAGDESSISGSGRSPGGGKGYPPQYSGLENSMGCIVRGVTKSWTRLSDFDFHCQPHAEGGGLISTGLPSVIQTPGPDAF